MTTGDTTRAAATGGPDLSTGSVLEARDCSIFYGDKCAVSKVSMTFAVNRVTALIGPSGCGKSTLLRALNRMNDNIPGARLEGSVLYRGQDIYDSKVDPAEVRKRIGMVFQKPNPFPKTIFENVAFGPRLQGLAKKEGKQALAGHVERCLKGAGLWDEVCDRLEDPALSLSGGQQQRLCIARAIANDPEVLLMDEPCSALDPISTARIEDLIEGMRETYTIVIVTHNMEQARRISDNTGFLLSGDLIEFNNTNDLFSRPGARQTEDYITGRFG